MARTVRNLHFQTHACCGRQFRQILQRCIGASVRAAFAKTAARIFSTRKPTANGKASSIARSVSRYANSSRARNSSSLSTLFTMGPDLFCKRLDTTNQVASVRPPYGHSSPVLVDESPRTFVNQTGCYLANPFTANAVFRSGISHPRTVQHLTSDVNITPKCVTTRYIPHHLPRSFFLRRHSHRGNTAGPAHRPL